jgi:hypothetical protein
MSAGALEIAYTIPSWTVEFRFANVMRLMYRVCAQWLPILHDEDMPGSG